MFFVFKYVDKGTPLPQMGVVPRSDPHLHPSLPVLSLDFVLRMLNTDRM